MTDIILREMSFSLIEEVETLENFWISIELVLCILGNIYFIFKDQYKDGKIRDNLRLLNPIYLKWESNEVILSFPQLDGEWGVEQKGGGVWEF